MSRIIIANLILLFLISCSTSSTKTDESSNKFKDENLQKIYSFQDERNSNSLLPYLKDSNPIYREAAALAFSSVQDSATLENLHLLLKDENEKVKLATAYAIGQTRNAISLEILKKHLKSETNLNVKNAILEAIGKCSTDSTDVEYIAGINNNELGVVNGLYRAGLKNISSPIGTAKIFDILSRNNNKEVRLMASNYLYRFRRLGFEKYVEELKSLVTSDNDPYVRMNAVMALSQSNKDNIMNLLISRFSVEKSYLVKVNILRSLGGFDFNKTKEFYINSLNDKDNHVAFTAAQIIGRLANENEAKQLFEILKNAKYWRVKVALLSVVSKHNKNVFNYVKDVYSKSTNIYEKAALLGTITSIPESYSWLKGIYANESNLIIKSNALQSIIVQRNDDDIFNNLLKTNKNSQNEIADIYKNSIKSLDAGLVFYASRELRKEDQGYKSILKDFTFLKSSLNKLKLPLDIEAFVELQKTLDYFEEKEKPTELPKFDDLPINWTEILKINKGYRSTLKTSKGDIELELLIEDAPGSVSNFVKLANNGFYNNKTFHRVIANFVAQGGCPRGDGFGGLEYSIRSEFAPLNYREGYLGMASAGKDTESCQWFITHSPTPHLDGRYTIFGKVTSGMDVVHKLDIGDEILKIE